MSRDPLEQFRRGTTRPQQPPPPPVTQPPVTQPPAQAGEDEELMSPRRFDTRTGREIYQAFRVTRSRREHLEIRQAESAWQFPRFFDLSDMTVNQRLGTEIVLQFPLYAVFIAGKNLQQLVYALKQHRCDFMEEYHPQKFAPVGDEKEPLITSMVLRLKAANPPAEPKGHTVN